MSDKESVKHHNKIEYNKKWAKEHPENTRRASDKWKSKNWERAMWLVSKANALKMGRDFDIDIEDIIIPEKCPYLEVKLTRELRRSERRFNPSLDRIDSTLGYIKGNVRVISNLANRMKINCTDAELLTFAKNIMRLHNTHE